MGSKHTPGPWFAKREGFSTIYIEARLRQGVLQEVAACGPTEAGPEQQEANAEHIVRACNSHEQLVAALRDLLAEYEWTTDSAYCQVWADHEVVNQVNAALAAAGAA